MALPPATADSEPPAPSASRAPGRPGDTASLYEALSPDALDRDEPGPYDAIGLDEIDRDEPDRDEPSPYDALSPEELDRAGSGPYDALSPAALDRAEPGPYAVPGPDEPGRDEPDPYDAPHLYGPGSADGPAAGPDGTPDAPEDGPRGTADPVDPGDDRSPLFSRLSQLAWLAVRASTRVCARFFSWVFSRLVRFVVALRIPERLRNLPVGSLVGNRYALIGLVVVALAALYGAAHFSTPRAGADVARARPERAAVVSALTVCPGAEMGGGSATRFGLVSPAAGTGTGSAGVTRSSGGQAGALRRVGTGWFGDVSKPAAPLVVNGSGALAAGLTGGQISAGKDDADKLSSTHCTRPATDSWFVGPGPMDGDLRLRLANPDDGPATVSVDVYSDAGELDTSDAGAIFVPPHGTANVSLADRAATAQLAALHVRTSMGRVSAAIQATGKDHDGADWVPAGSGPAKRLIVPGVPAGSGGRQLLVAAPDTQDATVQVQAVTADGTVTPGGQGPITVPAGAVVPVALDGQLSGKAAALTITSDRPVVAGLRADSGIDGGKDVAYTAAEPPLDGRGVEAVNRADDDYASSVVLSAIDGDVTVRVATLGPGGSGAATSVRVKAGHTTEVTPAAPKGSDSGYGIVVTGQSGTGKLYAARVLTRKVDGGKLLTVDPLESAAATVPVYPASELGDAVVR